MDGMTKKQLDEMLEADAVNYGGVFVKLNAMHKIKSQPFFGEYRFNPPNGTIKTL